MGLLFTILLTAWALFVAVLPIFRKRFRDSGLLPVVILGSSIMAYGMLGWFSGSLSVDGAFDRFPPSFEFPIWRTESAATLADGTHAVAHMPSGRIQLYDRDWHYLRGWRVPSGGGDIHLLTPSKDQICVWLEHGDGRATYDLNGKLLNLEWDTPRPAWVSREKVTVPTPFLLRSFSDPMLSWVIGAIGLALLALCHAIIGRLELTREGRAILEHVADLEDAAPEPPRIRH